jgi:hypothetical protein
MSHLVADILLLIFTELQDHPTSLYSCVLVNKSWYYIAMPILWNFVSITYGIPYNQKPETREKLYNLIAHFLPNGPADPLAQNSIILPLNKIPRAPTFNYINYLTRITPHLIKDMIKFLIKENSTYKKNILENEIYKMVFTRCKNIKYFYWHTATELYNFPNARPFFSSLQSFGISFEFNYVTSNIVYQLTNICQDILDLEINYCKEDSPYLISFIKNQRNLRSLSLHFNNNDDDDEEVLYPLLSKAIIDKATTLKKIILTPLVTSINPMLFIKLINLQYLELNNDEGGDSYEDVNFWKLWEFCLSKATFPDLQYFGSTFVPNSIESLIIKNSGGNIVEIDIQYPLEFQDYPAKNKQLLEIISNNCPKLISLTIDIDSKNLREVSNIFSNCPQLEKLHFATKNHMSPNGDELLEIISNESPLTIREFSFGDNWNFSINGLESFFKNWKHKNRHPIKFINYYDEVIDSWTDDHDELVKRYKDEGIIL